MKITKDPASDSKVATGRLINGEDDHWEVNCPVCGSEYEYIGLYDPDDVTKCKCGATFKTKIEAP